MTPERWKRIEELYQAASQLPEDERSRYLNEACPDDADLRQEVEGLVQQQTEKGFLDPPALADAASALASGSAVSTRTSTTPIIGKTIGHYAS